MPTTSQQFLWEVQLWLRFCKKLTLFFCIIAHPPSLPTKKCSKQSSNVPSVCVSYFYPKQAKEEGQYYTIQNMIISYKNNFNLLSQDKIHDTANPVLSYSFPLHNPLSCTCYMSKQNQVPKKNQVRLYTDNHAHAFLPNSKIVKITDHSC